MERRAGRINTRNLRGTKCLGEKINGKPRTDNKNSNEKHLRLPLTFYYLLPDKPHCNTRRLLIESPATRHHLRTFIKLNLNHVFNYTLQIIFRIPPLLYYIWRHLTLKKDDEVLRRHVSHFFPRDDCSGSNMRRQHNI